VWDNDVLGTPAAQRDFFRFCSVRRISTLFLHAPADHLRERAPEFRAFLATAHRERVRVEALDGAPGWAFDGAKPRRFVEAVLTFNRESERPEERFDGIHLDVEPYDSPQWHESEPTVIAHYLAMLAEVQQQAAGLPLAADVPPWFANVETPDGTVLSAMLAHVEGIGLMAYARQMKAIVKQGRPAVETARRRGKQVWVGISVQPQSSDMDAKRPVRPQVEAVIKKAERAFRHTAGFAGVAIHDYEQLRELYDRER
jgi:hypothetical protein